MSVGAGPTVTLTTGQTFFLRISQLAFSMSQALSLRKLADMMHGTTSLSQGPIWLLGAFYGAAVTSPDSKALSEEALEAMLSDFHSRLWLTYRKDFPSLGPLMLTSDIGWGCTIRSGQMLVAEALARVTLGRSWSRGSGALEEVQPIVELFLDNPEAPLSIHRICEAGVSAGIVPGRWVGPWMLCKSLEALFAQFGERRPVGLRLYVACGSGGGAPELEVASIRGLMAAAASAAEQVDATGTAPQPDVQQQLQQRFGEEASGTSPPQETAAAATADDLPSTGGLQASASADGRCAGERQQPPGPSAAAFTPPGDEDVRDPCAEPAAGAGFMDSESMPQASCSPCNGTQQQCSNSSNPAAAVGALERQPAATPRVGRTGEDDSQEPGGTGEGPQEAEGAPTHGTDAAAVPGSSRSSSGAAVGADATLPPSTTAAAATTSPADSEAGPQDSQDPGLSGGPGGSHEVGAEGQRQKQEREAQAGPSGRPAAAATPVLILVPFTLGMDKINPTYVPQLQQILTWPQSVGIIGGRPSASLYLCGVQDGSFLYLDPHEAQPAVRPPAAAAASAATTAAAPVSAKAAVGAQPRSAGPHSNGCASGAAAAEPQAVSSTLLPAGALASYFCNVVRVLPAATLDPSMALGFVCSGLADLEDLFSRLEALAREHSAAPLMTLAADGRAGGRAGRLGPDDGDADLEDEADADAERGGGSRQQLDDWELV